MRRRFLTLLLLALGAALLAACRGAAPAIAVETTRLDLGDVANGVVVTRDVVVTNRGDGPLVVESITTSCGCTTATLEPMTLAPGASGTLRIAFDAGAHGPALTGPLVRQVFINSNDPTRPELAVELAVNVTAPVAEGP